MKAATLGVAAATGLLSGALLAAGYTPTAEADSPQTQYSQYLISHGMYGDMAPDGNTWLQDGQQVCAALQAGQSEGQQTGQLESRMGRAQSSVIVYAAHHYLCPGA